MEMLPFFEKFDKEMRDAEGKAGKL